MPQDPHNDQKATSPSPTIQRGVDKSWGEQQKATTDPAAAIADKHTNHPVQP